MDNRLVAALTAVATALSGAIVRYVEGLGTKATYITSQESYTALLQALIECTNHR